MCLFSCFVSLLLSPMPLRLHFKLLKQLMPPSLLDYLNSVAWRAVNSQKALAASTSRQIDVNTNRLIHIYTLLEINICTTICQCMYGYEAATTRRLSLICVAIEADICTYTYVSSRVSVASELGSSYHHSPAQSNWQAAWLPFGCGALTGYLCWCIIDGFLHTSLLLEYPTLFTLPNLFFKIWFFFTMLSLAFIIFCIFRISGACFVRCFCVFWYNRNKNELQDVVVGITLALWHFGTLVKTEVL